MSEADGAFTRQSITRRSAGITNLAFDEPVIFELGSEGRRAVSLPGEDATSEPAPGPSAPARSPDIPFETTSSPRGSASYEAPEGIPPDLVRPPIDGFPEVSEVELVRHYTRLSQWNYAIDSGFYPLGSCTMKYNPKLNEEAARIAGFAFAHPLQPESLSQGSLRVMHDLERFLCEITGMDRATLQPAAGAQGELTAMMVLRASFEDAGKPRRKVLVPDTAHGTNPASVAMCGFSAVPLKSNRKGFLDKDTVRSAMDEDTAGIMITNPNTLGIFEADLPDIAEIVHAKGGFVYGDGANLNALLGVARPGDLGIDLVHVNLHKTFSTPHGGGGPGAGPLAVKARFAPYLPAPVVIEKEDRLCLSWDLPKSIGKVKSFYGNFLVCLRAYAYILTMGPEGLKRAARTAVVNANYIRARLAGRYHLPYDTPSMHECVFTDRVQQENHVSTLDIAKRLIDYGFHPPTIYFPLVVQGALMIEPTETESRETLDAFVEAMLAIAEEAEKNPELLRGAPSKSKVTRIDEVEAARSPVLRYVPGKGASGA
jgi:glycine dehydrogenase subunit 2